MKLKKKKIENKKKNDAKVNHFFPFFMKKKK